MRTKRLVKNCNSARHKFGLHKNMTVEKKEKERMSKEDVKKKKKRKS